MFIDQNVQLMLCTLSADQQNANTLASESSSQMGTLISQQLQALYTYWNNILEPEAQNSHHQNQYNLDSTEAQNEESTMNSDVSSVNTNVTNLSTTMKQLSSFSTTITNFMLAIAGLIANKLG